MKKLIIILISFIVISLGFLLVLPQEEKSSINLDSRYFGRWNTSQGFEVKFLSNGTYIPLRKGPNYQPQAWKTKNNQIFYDGRLSGVNYTFSEDEKTIIEYWKGGEITYTKIE